MNMTHTTMNTTMNDTVMKHIFEELPPLNSLTWLSSSGSVLNSSEITSMAYGVANIATG